MLEKDDWAKYGDLILHIEHCEGNRQKRVVLWLISPVCPVCKSTNELILRRHNNHWEISCCGNHFTGDFQTIDRSWGDIYRRAGHRGNHLHGHLPGMIPGWSLEDKIKELHSAQALPQDSIAHLTNHLNDFEKQIIMSSRPTGREKTALVRKAGKNLIKSTKHHPKLVYLAILLRSRTVEIDIPTLGISSYFDTLLTLLDLTEIEFDQEDHIDLINWGFSRSRMYDDGKNSTSYLFKFIARSLNGVEPSPELQGKLLTIKDWLLNQGFSRTDGRECIKYIDICLGLEEDFTVKVVDAWSAAFNEKIGDQIDDWKPLIKLTESLTTPKPTKKFIQTAFDLVAKIGVERYIETIEYILDSIGSDSPLNGEQIFLSNCLHRNPTLIDSRETQTLRGLILACSAIFQDDLKLLESLVRAAKACYEEVPKVGPRSLTIGNTIVYLISQNPTYPAKRALYEIRMEVTHVQSLKVIDKAIREYDGK